MMARSSELEQALSDAQRRAAARGQTPGTLDLLTALLEREPVRRVAPGVSLRAGGAPLDGPPAELERLLAQAERLAERCASESVCGLHALAVLCRDTETAAYAALFAGGHDPTRIRAAALRELTAPPPKRRTRSAASAIPTATSARAAHPQVGDCAHPRPNAAPPLLPPAPGPAPAPAPAPIRDLVAAARAGELEPLLGRERELALLCDVLGKRRGALACVVGEPGTGKTALVHGLARLLARTPAAVPALRAATLLAVESSIAPAQVTSDRPFVLFYDGAPETAVMTALAQAGNSAIVALTPTDLRRLEETAPLVSGRVSQVLLAEPPAAET